jgi:protoporphyrinogen oxidase
MPLGRLRLFDDERAELLKRIPDFDHVLAVPSTENPMRFYPDAKEEYPHKNYYPSSGGMHGFVSAIEDYLKCHNVSIRREREVSSIRSESGRVQVELDDSERIEADELLWAADFEDIGELLDDERSWQVTRDVPMVLYYFFLPATTNVQYTYLHDFSKSSPIYRLSSPGFYGKQANDAGESYICAEVPTSMDSAVWNDPQQYVEEIWGDVLEYGMIDIEESLDTHVMQTPVSYPMYSVGARSTYEELSRHLGRELPGVHVLDLDAFSKLDIVRNVRSLLAETLDGKNPDAKD